MVVAFIVAEYAGNIIMPKQASMIETLIFLKDWRVALKMKSITWIWAVVAVAVLGLSIAGCSKDADRSAKEADKLVIAKVDGQEITADVLEKYLAARPLQMNAENSAEMFKKRVDEVVVDELLYQEALRLKLDQEPDTRQRIRQVLNQKLSEQQINKTVMQRKIEQPELQAYYDAHQDEFNRPEMVRVADILVAVPKDASNEQRAELKQKAEKILSEILAAPNPNMIFPQSARKYSDQPEKYAKGDTGFFTRDGKPMGMDPAVVEAAYQLEKSGDIAKAIIEAGDGYHIIMQTGKNQAFNRPFDQVARFLERRIRNEELQKKRDEFVQELKAKSKIVMDEKALAQIMEKTKTTAKMKPMPPVNRTFPPIPAGGGNPSPSFPGSGNHPSVMPGQENPPPNPGGAQQPPSMPGNQGK